MEFRDNVYVLEKICDDPRYDGFSGRGFPETFPRNRTTLKWRVVRLAPKWIPMEVRGRVRKFNDYPCINLVEPAFSARAVEALRDLLEPNGELLPLASPLGEYFAFNATTVGDVLDVRRSDIQWVEGHKPITAFEVLRYEFVAEKVRELTVFRIPQNPPDVYVTEAFVARAVEHGLRGMDFRRVWPLPAGVSWWKLAKEQGEKRRAEGLPPGQTVKGNTVVLFLNLADRRSKGTEVEKKAVNKLMDALDAFLVDFHSDAPAVGSLQGFDYGVPGECRLFLVCPDADALVNKLRPWLKKLKWPKGFSLIKRYGNFADIEAREEPVENVVVRDEDGVRAEA